MMHRLRTLHLYNHTKLLGKRNEAGIKIDLYIEPLKRRGNGMNDEDIIEPELFIMT